MTNLDRLAAIGEALHGERWHRAVARDLDIGPRQVQRWVSGEYDVPDRIVAELEAVARRRVAEIERALGG